jgi:hypothetical protein
MLFLRPFALIPERPGCPRRSAVVLIEASNAIGGVWHHNGYPGARLLDRLVALPEGVTARALGPMPMRGKELSVALRRTPTG